MIFRTPEPDPRLIRLAERIGLDPSQTTAIRADYEGGAEVVKVTATVVVTLTWDEFRAVWDGEPVRGGEPTTDDQVTPKDAALIAYALSVAVGDGWIDTPPEQQRAMELQAHFDKLSNEGS